VIALIRDGNDAILSGMRRGKKNFRGAAYRWCRAVEIIHEIKSRYPEQVLVVSFEDLVLRPTQNIKRIARFLKVEYQERMLEGPVYNPWYPESGMNENKVNRSKKEQIDFKIPERFPAAERQYRELLRLCDIVEVTDAPKVVHG
jgi:Sulfotransferase family